MDRQQAMTGIPTGAGAPLASAPHADEMTARAALTLGGGGSLVLTARATPAGLRAVGVLVSAILLSTAVLVRAAKRRG